MARIDDVCRARTRRTGIKLMPSCWMCLDIIFISAGIGAGGSGKVRGASRSSAPCQTQKHKERNTRRYYCHVMSCNNVYACVCIVCMCMYAGSQPPLRRRNKKKLIPPFLCTKSQTNNTRIINNNNLSKCKNICGPTCTL